MRNGKGDWDFGYEYKFVAPFRNLKWKFQLNNVVSSIVFKKVISGVLEINGRERIEDKQLSWFLLTKWILKQT